MKSIPFYLFKVIFKNIYLFLVNDSKPEISPATKKFEIVKGILIKGNILDCTDEGDFEACLLDEPEKEE